MLSPLFTIHLYVYFLICKALQILQLDTDIAHCDAICIVYVTSDALCGTISMDLVTGVMSVSHIVSFK